MSAQDILRSFAEARDDDNLSIRDGITYGTAREIMRAIDAALARAEAAEEERDTLVLAMGEMGGRLMDAEDHAVCNLCHCCNDAPGAHEESLADWLMRAHVAEEARRVVTVRAEAAEKRIKEGTEAWRAAYEAHGLVYRRTCLWIKPDGMPQYSGDRPGMGYETFVAMHATGASRWNGGGRHGVWRVNKGEGKQDHPTTKPLALMSQLVAMFTDPGDLVLDPFAGSGTTGRACKDLGRKCWMIEKEEKYCEIAAKRLSQEVLDLGASA